MTNQAVPDAATQLTIYRCMALIKANDERSRKVILTGKLIMPYFSPRGQEVIPSAVSANLTRDDYICTIYRGIQDMLAKVGCTPSLPDESRAPARAREGRCISRTRLPA